MKQCIKKTFGSVAILYSPRFVKTAVYMLQKNKYQLRAYLKWFWQTPDFRQSSKSNDLHQNKAAVWLSGIAYLDMLFEVSLGVVLIYAWRHNNLSGSIYYGLALIVATPIVWAHLIIIPALIGRYLKPRSAT